MVQRNWWVKAAVGMCLAGMGLGVHATGPARSLIVQLRPSAAEGQLIGTSSQLARQARLQRLAQAAGYPATMPWRSLGGRMTSLRVPTPLTPAKSRELAARLVATGQVDWVEPNVRQKRLAVDPIPVDPYYTRTPLDLSQWWLKDATSGNATPQVLRQRGAPRISAAWISGATGDRQVVDASRPGESGIVVAVLDTGHLPHPDIAAARILPGYDFVDDLTFSGDGNGRDADATDPGDAVSAAESTLPAFRELDCKEERSSWHGMVITGIIAATVDNQGVAGISRGARILPVRVAGKCGADVEDIVAGIRWAAGETVYGVPNPNPARIINVSFGGDGECGPAYLTAVQEAKLRGAVVVAAAGNEHRAVSRPASCDGVIGVAALNREGFKATYSNFGRQVAVSTVGGDPGPASGFTDSGLWGLWLGDTGLLTVDNQGLTTVGAYDYAYHAGTSFSAPVVSGVISLMLDINPALTPDQIRQGLQVSARPHVTSSRMGQCASSNPGRCLCTTNTCGAGILDAAEAVRYAGNPMGYSRSSVAESIDAAEVIQAVNAYAQDRPPNSVGSSSGGNGDDEGDGGGGGGAVDGVLVGMLGVLLGSLVLGRWGALRSGRLRPRSWR